MDWSSPTRSLETDLSSGLEVVVVEPGSRPASNVCLRWNWIRRIDSSQSVIRKASPSPRSSTALAYFEPRMRPTTFVSLSQVSRCQQSQSHWVMKSF